MIAVAAAVVVAGAIFGGYLLLSGPDPEQLRDDIRRSISKKDFPAARETLKQLRETIGGLTKQDRRKLAAPVSAWLNNRVATLQKRIKLARRDKHWDGALAALGEIEELKVKADWVLFTKAEILREAGRKTEAIEHYARHFTSFPGSRRADDSLFWQALILKEEGQPDEARALLKRLLDDYPKSNFRKSARRMLADL